MSNDMKMLLRLNGWRKRQRFLPDPLGIFFNPLFIIRRGLYLSIRQWAPSFHGMVLDFGAGSAPYRELFYNAESYVTVDIEVSGHERSDKVSDNFYDGHVLPFSTKTFDAIFSSEVFEHIFNLPEVLCDLHRVLKPGGRMLITAPFVWEEHEVPYDFARYTSFGLVYLLEEAGFVVEKQIKTTGYVETVFQMISIYMLQNSPLWSNALRPVGTLLIATPINALGILLNFLMPRDQRFFHNLVIICRRAGVG